jgi:hypothetical protein
VFPGRCPESAVHLFPFRPQRELDKSKPVSAFTAQASKTEHKKFNDSEPIKAVIHKIGKQVRCYVSRTACIASPLTTRGSAVFLWLQVVYEYLQTPTLCIVRRRWRL